MRRLRRPKISWQAGAVLVAGLFVISFIVALVVLDNRAGRRLDLQQRTQEATTAQLVKLTDQVASLQSEKTALKASEEKAKAQANTSVGQLVQAGEKPIINGPGVVTVNTTPAVTSTSQPVIIVNPPATTAPETTTTTTTTAPPPETTTTLAPVTTTTTAGPTTTTPSTILP